MSEIMCGTRSISKNEPRPARPPHPPFTQGHGPGTDPFNCLNILGMPRDFVFTKVFLFLCLWTLSKELYRYLRGDTLYVPPGARWPGILSEYFLSAVI